MMGISELLGQTLSDVTKSDYQIVFTLNDGRKFKMWHAFECCESVSVEDICGDLNDLVGSPLTMAEETTSNKDPEGIEKEHGYDAMTFTWTFYRFATIKGYVTIRWYGESNGCYSESVDFEEIKG